MLLLASQWLLLIPTMTRKWRFNMGIQWSTIKLSTSGRNKLLRYRRNVIQVGIVVYFIFRFLRIKFPGTVYIHKKLFVG